MLALRERGCCAAEGDEASDADDIASMVAKLDLNKDGFVDKGEWRKAWNVCRMMGMAPSCQKRRTWFASYHPSGRARG